jgi:hypothetical protein
MPEATYTIVRDKHRPLKQSNPCGQAGRTTCSQEKFSLPSLAPFGLKTNTSLGLFLIGYPNTAIVGETNPGRLVKEPLFAEGHGTFRWTSPHPASLSHTAGWRIPGKKNTEKSRAWPRSGPPPDARPGKVSILAVLLDQRRDSGINLSLGSWTRSFRLVEVCVHDTPSRREGVPTTRA